MFCKNFLPSNIFALSSHSLYKFLFASVFINEVFKVPRSYITFCLTFQPSIRAFLARNQRSNKIRNFEFRNSQYFVSYCTVFIFFVKKCQIVFGVFKNQLKLVIIQLIRNNSIVGCIKFRTEFRTCTFCDQFI